MPTCRHQANAALDTWIRHFIPRARIGQRVATAPAIAGRIYEMVHIIIEYTSNMRNALR
jgi:hypothetical protein